MMKKLLSFIIIVLIAGSVSNAQSLSLSWDGEAVADTTTIWVNPDSGDPFSFHAVVTNNADKIIKVKVLRTNIDVLEGSSNSFCFASQCYPPFMDESADYVVLNSGESNAEDDFHGDFLSGGAIGTSLVSYRFFDIDNPTDYVEAIVKFWSSPTGLDENIKKGIEISNAYPNPANDKFNINYNFETRPADARVKIVNLLGSVVKEVELDQNSDKLSMDISDLNAGVYFYSVIINNEIYQTKKLVIR